MTDEFPPLSRHLQLQVMENAVKSLMRICWLCLLFVAVLLWMAPNETLPREKRATSEKCRWQVKKYLWPTEPPAPFSEMVLISTLVPDPKYKAPGNLAERLSTQPAREAAERPYRVLMLDSQAKYHYYLSVYHR